MTGRVLVMAKAPVAGRAKTRLAAGVGAELAAELAAAAMLDTLAACTAAFEERHLALDGDLADAARGGALEAALDGWRVFAQDGADFGARLAHAHAYVGDGDRPLVQIGTDTPQVTAAQLRAAARTVTGSTAGALGPAYDGGWWALVLRDPRRAAVLAEVPMSTDRTCTATRDAFAADGIELATLPSLRDVDTASDAVAVAAAAPATRFATLWRTSTNHTTGVRA